LRLLLVAGLAVAFAGCTHSDFDPNVIVLHPNGTSSSPAAQPITKSFTLFAVEDGYTGQFTADTIKGDCWVVQTPVSTGGAWTVVPQGTTCDKLDTEQIRVEDQKGNSATTFIRSVKGKSSGS
jgi:hypothetical protein